MLESMEKLIDELDLLPRGSTVLCAVSGGADSVCLLHALYRLRPRLGFRLAAAHYNHNLRGGDSQRDAAFVEQFVALNCGAQRDGEGRLLPAVALFTASGDVAAEAARRGTGIEETAREMRYAFLRQVAGEIGAQAIATAHTADDNLETILFHLARGSGLQGLTGIRPAQNGLIRPLLNTTRREVEQYLFFHALPHREDATNRDCTYARNRIRIQAVPVLESICPGVAARTADTAARLRADERYLSDQAAQLSDQAVEEEDRLTISAGVIARAPMPLAIRAVRQLITRANGGDSNCTAVHLESVVELCRSSDPSAQLNLPRGLMVRREYEQLVFTHGAPPAALREEVFALPGTTRAQCWQLVCTEETYTGQPCGPFEFWLDREKVTALTLRSRRTGDLLALPGRPTKPVKKWLIDEKVPRMLRDSLPVLDCGGRVAAVVGLGGQEELLPGAGQQAWHICCTPK